MFTVQGSMAMAIGIYAIIALGVYWRAMSTAPLIEDSFEEMGTASMADGADNVIDITTRKAA
jgi:hypothetical protein